MRACAWKRAWHTHVHTHTHTHTLVIWWSWFTSAKSCYVVFNCQPKLFCPNFQHRGHCTTRSLLPKSAHTEYFYIVSYWLIETGVLFIPFVCFNQVGMVIWLLLSKGALAEYSHCFVLANWNQHSFIPFVCFDQVVTVIWFWFLSGSPLVNQVAGACWTWWTWTRRRGWRCRWRSGCATTRTPSAIACSTSSVWSSATHAWRTTWSLPPWCVFCCWLLLSSATVCCWADSLHSHVILHEWLAFYSLFLNSRWSGVLTCTDMAGARWNCCCLGTFCVRHTTMYHVTSCKITYIGYMFV